MQFTDSHCHLDDQVFIKHLPQLLAQCQQLNIHRIIIPAIKPDNFDSVLSLPQQYHQKLIKLYACLGIHPWFLNELNESHLNLLAAKVAQNVDNIIAIGETGIDGAIAKHAQENYGQSAEENLAKQSHFFDYQLQLAKKHDLPVIVHHRQSHDKIIPLLKKHKIAKAGIVHAFSGSYQQAKDYVDLGFKLGIGGTITYPRAKKTINAIKRLPLESLVLETDAPSMPLSSDVSSNDIGLSEQELKLGGTLPANSPVNIIRVFQVLTKIREEDEEQLAEQIEKNINQVFFS